MTTQELLTEFQSKNLEVTNHIQNAFITDTFGNYTFSKEFRHFIIDASIVKIYVIWESFLEKCFTNYTMNIPSISGMNYVRYATPINEDHAQRMALGTQTFIEWGNPDIVMKLCKLYLDSGEPFRSTIASILSDLTDLRNIRNAAAHTSNTTQNKLEAVAARILDIPSPGITVSELVLTIHPRGNANENILQYYMNLLEAAAFAISR